MHQSFLILNLDFLGDYGVEDFSHKFVYHLTEMGGPTVTFACYHYKNINNIGNYT